MRTFITTLICLFLTAFSTISHSFDATHSIGQSEQSLVKSLGTPNLIMTLPNGNKLYIYTNYEQIQIPNMSNPSVIVAPGGQAVAASIPPDPRDTHKVLRCEKVFEVDKHGLIIKSTMRGIC